MEKPENLHYVDLLRTWAVSVARCVVWFAVRERETGGLNVPHECWVDEYLALYLRYGRGPQRFGARIARLDVNPTSAAPLHPFLRENSSGTSMQQASNFFHGELDLPPRGPFKWTDPLGYRWQGIDPGEGWAQAVERSPRVATVFPEPPHRT